MAIPVRKYDECVSSGRVLISKFQYERMSSGRTDFEPIQVSKDTTMYRFRGAPQPYTGRVYDPATDPIVVPENADAFDEMTTDHQRIVQAILMNLRNGERLFLFEGDEDEDFTYYALCSALRSAPGDEDESDWLLTKEFGRHYSLRHMQDVLDALAEE